MYAGAVGLGEAVSHTHAADWLAVNVIPQGLPVFLILSALALFSIALTEGISNAAVVAVLVPVGFGLCDVTGISPVIMIYVIAVPAGLAFNMPMASPPCAIAYSAGYYGVMQVATRGIFLNAAALLVFLLLAWFYWPLVGLVP